MVTDFSPFFSRRPEASVLKGIPMSMYNADILNEIRSFAGPIRVKFRGPRPAGRTRSQRRATCLKKDAVTFSVYFK